MFDDRIEYFAAAVGCGRSRTTSAVRPIAA
jgi:hypothetical protein